MPKNRLFADTSLSYMELNLSKIADSLNLLYSKAIQAKNQVLRVNDQLGENYLFGGASLTKKPFDENTLEYKASIENFEVWLSENY